LKDKIYKATKTSPNGDVKSNGKATIEDGDEDEDLEAGPESPPEEEEAGPEDDEGRFYGGGITKNTTAVLDFIEEQGKDEPVNIHDCHRQADPKLSRRQKPEKVDITWLRKLALNFEKRISKNAELRAKFGDTPAKYVRATCQTWWVCFDMYHQVYGLRSRSRYRRESAFHPL